MFRYLGLLSAAVALGACTPQAPKNTPIPPKPAETTTVGPSSPPVTARVVKGIPGFSATADALKVFRRACPRLLRREDQSGLTQTADWQAACADTEPDPTSFFVRHFTPVQLNDGKGMATGYYEPDIAGYTSPMPGAAPILKRPPNLVDVRLSDWNIQGGTIRGLLKGNQVVRAPDRAAIEKGAFAGQGLELAWAADPIDLFFLHIQGSGRLKMPDGSSMRIGYDGQNGHTYVAIGKLLRDRGILEKAGMAEIKDWLRANPAEGIALMRENPSYIFLRRLPDNIDGPIGALNIPILPLVNVAADPAAMPLGAPVWIETSIEGQPFNHLAVASDTGGAIKGANRFDIFFGNGPEAARKAGALAAPARAFILLPNAAAQRLPQ